jgi:hypothetical protein
MRYQYPKDAVEALFRTSSAEVIQALFPIKVPRHLVYSMAEIAYHASFLTEEGRPTRFQLALLSRDRVFAGPGEIDEEMTILRLDSARQLSVKELLRLAPAVDFTTTLICVDAMMHIPGIANRELEIWGIVSPGTSSKRLTRLQSREAVHVPTCLTVSSTCPGHVQLGLNIRPLVILRAGRVSVLPRQPRKLPGPVMRLLHGAGLTTSANGNVVPNSELETKSVLSPELIQAKYVEVFCRLLMSLSDTHHGLTLLFVRSSSLPLHENVLSIKYAARCERLGRLLREFVLADTRLTPVASGDSPARRIDGLLSEALDAIAAVSAVDGALVVSDRLELIGFGAEIRANDTTLNHMHFSSGGSESKFSPRPLTDFGTRHRSAARFCRAVPDAVAFVVSQDGDRRLMTCVDEEVRVWTDLAWDRLWETV